MSKGHVRFTLFGFEVCRIEAVDETPDRERSPIDVVGEETFSVARKAGLRVARWALGGSF